MPQRFTPELVAVLSRHAPLSLVSHVNHAREITQESREAWRSLSRGGVMLLSQSVLMRGVNDDEGTLSALFEELLDAGVKPYYLHHLDPTIGTAHFRVPIRRGIELMQALQGRISGTALPAYVMEVPGGHGKVRVDSEAVTEGETEGTWQLRGPFGDRVLYDERDLGVIEPGRARPEIRLNGTR